MTACAATDCPRDVGPKGARGYCPMHYKRLRARGDVDFAWRGSVPDRFARYFTRGGPAECWEWTGGRDRDGYGTFTVAKYRPIRAHRQAWALASGRPVPAGIFVCHSCDNPPCVNPAHLFLGTPADNSADMASKGRQPGNRTGSIGNFQRRLTDQQVVEIRGSDGIPRKEVAALYGISQEHVRQIQNRTRRETVM